MNKRIEEENASAVLAPAAPAVGARSKKGLTNRCTGRQKAAAGELVVILVNLGCRP